MLPCTENPDFTFPHFAVSAILNGFCMALTKCPQE